MSRAICFAGVAALGACSTSGEGGASLGSSLFASSSPAPAAQAPVAMAAYCPRITVIEGASTMQSRAGVVSLGQLARECIPGPDGSVAIKIGAEGRAVLATAGGARFDVPVRFVVRNGGTVIANRVRRASVAVPAEQGSAVFALVEEGIVVPPSAVETFEIEVGLGAGSGRGPQG